MGGFLWGSPEEVAGPGLWLWLAISVWGKLSCAGPGWVQDEPSLPLEAVALYRKLGLAVREGFLLFQQADSHSLHTQLCRNLLAFLWMLQFCKILKCVAVMPPSS